jgi:2-oxoglutarate ferredoxin oxidoreductase subunit delta
MIVDIDPPRSAAERIGAPSAGRPAQPFVPLAIAAERCKGCGLCLDTCPKHVLALEPLVVNALGYHPVRLTDAAACTSCALCARICPDAVYTVVSRPKGS